MVCSPALADLVSALPPDDDHFFGSPPSLSSYVKDSGITGAKLKKSEHTKLKLKTCFENPHHAGEQFNPNPVKKKFVTDFGCPRACRFRKYEI
jgi:hypothetical protein